MPIYPDGQRSGGPRVAVRTSGILELEWLLHSALRRDFQDDHPSLGALYRSEPELLAAVRDLWDDHGESAAFTELVLVAHHGGLLFEADPSPVLDRFDELCTSLPSAGGAFPMEAETEADRRVIWQRLTRLRRSAPARARYVDVVRRVWDAASETFERYGGEAVAQAVATAQAALSRGATWRDLAKSSCTDEHADKLVANLRPGGEVSVVFSYFAHCGLLYDLPGLVIVGARADATGAESRARHQELARQLRAVSDPTRLAILDSVRLGRKSVTELSARFAIAQPTVSNHVKLLREVGLVTDERDGPRRKLVVRPGAAESLVEDLARVLGLDARVRPGCGCQTPQ